MEQNEIKSILKNDYEDINDRRSTFNRLIIKVINREIKNRGDIVHLNKD